MAEHTHAHAHGHDHGACCHHAHGSPSSAGKTAIDPVCGMKVDPATSKHRHEHDGTLFHFCSARCREKFIAAPDTYLKPATPPPPAPAGTIYTCPMHPEIRQVGPGSCPICGMALEPLAPSAESGPNEELIDMTRRFWIGLALTLPVAALEMGAHIPSLGLHGLLSPQMSVLAQLLLATPVVIWAGWPFFVRGWASVVNRSLNMFSLIALGTGAAYLYSLVAALAPGAFPAGFRGMGGAVAVYFEAAAVITVLVLLGQVLELRARGGDRRRHPGAAQSGSAHRTAHRRRRAGGGNPARPGAGGRPAAGPSG